MEYATGTVASLAGTTDYAAIAASALAVGAGYAAATAAGGNNSSPAAEAAATSRALTLLEHFNNSENDMYEHFRPAMTTISRTMPPVWWSIGIVGNLVALVVWLQPRMRHSSGFYLAALAVTDVGFLTLNVLFEINFGHGHAFLNVPGWCEAYSVVYLALQYASPALVLGFTVERYMSVCHPFKYVETLGSAKCTLRCVALLLASCLALAGIQGYLWTASDDGTCNLRGSSMRLWEAWTWFTEALVFGLLPLAVLVLNARVIVEVRRLSRLERLTTMTNTIDRRSTTVLLLGVSFYQIFTVLPSTAVYALYGHFRADGAGVDVAAAEADPVWQRHFDFMLVKHIVQQIGMSHYAANFFIYLLTGKLFRRQLYEIVVLRGCDAAGRVLRSSSSKFLGSFTTARTSLIAAAASSQRRKSAPAQTSSRLAFTNNNNLIVKAASLDAGKAPLRVEAFAMMDNPANGLLANRDESHLDAT